MRDTQHNTNGPGSYKEGATVMEPTSSDCLKPWFETANKKPWLETAHRKPRFIQAILEASI